MYRPHRANEGWLLFFLLPLQFVVELLWLTVVGIISLSLDRGDGWLREKGERGEDDGRLGELRSIGAR